MGEKIAQSIGARAYKECSALKIEGVDEVFEAATRASMIMRDGVPAHGSNNDGRHSRRNSGRGVVQEDAHKGWKCCVIC